MGRRSVKENKSEYQVCREEAGLTREEASEATGFLSDDKIEKLESGKTQARPEEVMALADAYRKPELIRWYCANECPIGQKYYPEVEPKELANIAIEILAELNNLNESRDRLISIASDSKVSPDEYEDFYRIKEELSEIAESARALQLWIEKKL